MESSSLTAAMLTVADAAASATASAAAAAAAASGTAPTFGHFAARAQQMSVPRQFLGSLIEFLQALATAYPENTALAHFLKDMQACVGDGAREKNIIERWHYEMKHVPHTGKKRSYSLYSAVEERDVEAFVTGGLWVMQNIFGHEVFYDAHMSEDTRLALLEDYVDDLNTIAYLYAIIPEDAKRACTNYVRELAESAAPINKETITHVVQRTWSANTDNVIAWTSHLREELACPDAKHALLHALDMPALKPTLDKFGLGADQVKFLLEHMFTAFQASMDDGGDGGDGDGDGGGEGPMDSVMTMLQSMLLPALEEIGRVNKPGEEEDGGE